MEGYQCEECGAIHQNSESLYCPPCEQDIEERDNG